MPTLYMLIGIPGSGKTTWVNNNLNNEVVISTDNIIERIAAERGTTYDSIFLSEIKNAEKEMCDTLLEAIRNDRSIIWDQTNLNVKTRTNKLKMIPKHYRKVAVYFQVPKYLFSRLQSRPGKSIPDSVIDEMIEKLEFPSYEEGFSDIVVIGETE